MPPLVATAARSLGRGLFAALTLTLLLTAAPRPLMGHGDEAHVLRFDNGRWFDGERFVERTFYSVGGWLRAEHTGEVEATIDLGGGYVVPPFADAHRHVFDAGMDLEAQRVASLRQGIFYIKNPNNRRSGRAAAAEVVNRPTSVDVTFSNGGLTAPGGHPIQIYERHAEGGGFTAELAGDAYVTVGSAADLERVWPDVLAGEPDFLKVYLLHSERGAKGRRGLDPALLPVIVAKAHAAGLAVTAHADSAADVRAALDAGVDELAHLPLARLDAADAERLAAAGTTVVTTTLSHRPSPGVDDLDAVHRHNLKLLRAAGVTLALGTDNGAITVVDEAENLLRLGVLSPVELLRVWTWDSARAIFPERWIGRLSPGWEASFVVLEGDPLEDFSDVREIALRVKQGRVLDLPDAPAAKPSIAEAMMPLLMHGDLDGALARYRTLAEEQPDAYDFSEQQLNGLGYGLLGHDQPAAAVAVLRLNADVFPRSPNAWDSLAEALVAAGDTEGAIQAYRRVLALLPTIHDIADDFRQQLETRAREGLQALGAAP